MLKMLMGVTNTLMNISHKIQHLIGLCPSLYPTARTVFPYGDRRFVRARASLYGRGKTGI